MIYGDPGKFATIPPPSQAILFPTLIEDKDSSFLAYFSLPDIGQKTTPGNGLPYPRLWAGERVARIGGGSFAKQHTKANRQQKLVMCKMF